MANVIRIVKDVVKTAATLAYGGLISAMGLITLGGGLCIILGGVSSVSKDEKPKTEE